MFSIIITLTVLGHTFDVPLRDYYETPLACQEMKMDMLASMETREGVEAKIQCVKGWKIKF